ncbi:preprotein translocase, SecE subunit [Sphaerochaeta pleomorpha str. Grapes]|uniref:Protein translocase subunit SecE n=1 Tax=Sphaerochaeta pleomorpha (strain ATCC BAA-1885 / DSM 22778 / Grapes) TaxID=158190 RepID=G8QRH6_SPHPG|nr:preprotein translocase subunit SecE [Sphaerochaeta pleomorpha]AEV29898.1 preprotein translocase, SecE subunit [Sphaerochaeta pleomorpha str. Grapes]
MKKLVKYIKESRLELKKVVWPSRESVISSTKVVLVSTALVAVFLWLVDFILLKGILLIF